MSKGSYMELFNEAAEAYLEKHTTPEDPVLAELNRETHVKVMRPQMLSGHVQGKLLQFISQMQQPRNILEIGTYTGYSTICLARGLKPGGRIYTIDYNDELKPFATHYFNKAGIAGQVKAYWQDALEVLPHLNQTFNLVFMDADKRQYQAYFDAFIDKVPSGGLIVADNVLWYGKVLQEHKDEETQAIMAFNDYIYAHKAVEQVMLPVRDGLLLMQKR